MSENRLDNELKNIRAKLPLLWEPYDFHVVYITRDYGMYYKGFIIGLENSLCKLVFSKETNSPNKPIAEYIGTKKASFNLVHGDYSLQEGWYSLTGLIYWLTGVEYESNKNADQDLENVGQYTKLHIDKLLDLFRVPDEFDAKVEYYRNLHKENQITVEKIREERARLHALGQDSSLEAAIANLRGGKK